jgi:predicted nucleic acid-binding Zn finger protein
MSEERLTKALELLNTGKVLPIYQESMKFLVLGGENYLVDLETQYCPCLDRVTRGVYCKHILAAILKRNRIIVGEMVENA